MNWEYLIWIIRQMNVGLHALSGTVCILAFFINLLRAKGTTSHINWGSIYGICTVLLVITSLVSFLILRIFPFFLMAYMAYYLYYSSRQKTIALNLSFIIHFIFAVFVALFYLTEGRIGGYHNKGYAFSHWGILFGFFILWDFLRLVLKSKYTDKNFLFMHSNRLILSFFFVFTAFTVSQFSSLEEKKVFVLCYVVPMSVSGLLFLLVNGAIIYNQRKSLKTS